MKSRQRIEYEIWLGYLLEDWCLYRWSLSKRNNERIVGGDEEESFNGFMDFLTKKESEDDLNG